MKPLYEQAKNLKEWSVMHRRYLHSYPELSGQEKATAEYCQKLLVDMGYAVKNCYHNGFIANLYVNDGFKSIALRTDMDALPIQEEGEAKKDYISKTSGISHICGHDVHMATILTTAKLLANNSRQLKHNVRLIFQPEEEVLPGGALGMIKNGCLNNISEIYGMHVYPSLLAGFISTRSGPLVAAGDVFKLLIRGRGGHAAEPYNVLNPIDAAIILAQDWQSIIARKIKPWHPAILSITTLHAGNTINAIPQEATLSGSVRTYYQEDREAIKQLMRESLELLKLKGYNCKLDFQSGYNVVVNHKSGVKRLRDAAVEILDEKYIDLDAQPVGWSEDFSYYLEKCHGAFFLLGCSSNDVAKYQLHSPQFDIDENAISIGAAIMAQLFL